VLQLPVLARIVEGDIQHDARVKRGGFRAISIQENTLRRQYGRDFRRVCAATNGRIHATGTAIIHRSC
jgi:hypothetical protein